MFFKGHQNCFSELFDKPFMDYDKIEVDHREAWWPQIPDSSENENKYSQMSNLLLCQLYYTKICDSATVGTVAEFSWFDSEVSG